MRYNIETIVENFHNSLNRNKNHRYLSWEHCFSAFQDMELDDDYLALQLAFYLASWGMYRGSSGLLWLDYKIHIPAVRVIRSFGVIHCINGKEIENEDQLEKIMKLKEELSKQYKLKYYKPSKKMDSEGFEFTPSDTLISKILLGTLGCVPAYDRFLRKGFDQYKESNIGKSLNSKSLKAILKFINENKESFDRLQTNLGKNGVHYPKMKLVDMFFWEVGRLNSGGAVEG